MSHDFPYRQTIRLPGYDYSRNGLYFVTICTHNCENLFGDIVGAGSKPAQLNEHLDDNISTKLVKMSLNEYGEIIKQTWFDIINHNQGIKLHNYVVMPNHFHGIIEIDNDMADIQQANEPLSRAGLERSMEPLSRAGLEPAPTKVSLSEIVRQLKTFSAKRINSIRKTPGLSVWQRSYYDHIIRDEKSYQIIAEYINTNPQKWESDSLYKS